MKLSSASWGFHYCDNSINLIIYLNRIAVLLAGLFFLAGSLQTMAQPINRQALVQRHNVINKVFDSLSSLSVGNGQFCFTVDGTGLQSFPDFYAKGIPLGTEPEWDWNSFPVTSII